MEELNLLDDIVLEESMIYGVISNVRIRDENSFQRARIKPILIKDIYKLQITYEYKNKVIHNNFDIEDGKKEIINLLSNKFKQAVIFTIEADYQIFINKKNKVTILKKRPTKKNIDLNHNRKKEYILQEGKPVDFLVKLGVMSENGNIYNKKYDKFKQINRFLEMVKDIIENLNIEEEINIIDFGCGKSYLTFALYYYLVKILKLKVSIVGLDLKKDVVQFCNNLVEELKYEKLSFIYGDIKDYNYNNRADMVVTLHACDIATDIAITKAVKWGAKVILSVPCCQHELYNKINNTTLTPMLEHGLIKERLSSLVTDSLRANILEILGYQVQILEFIDMDHTPKNILIRAVKTNKKGNEEAIDKYLKFKEFWGLKDIYIEQVLDNRIKDLIKTRNEIEG